jgi:predicted ester cyclase
MPSASSPLRALFGQAFNQGNLAMVDELVSVDSSTHIPGWGMPANRLGLKQMITTLRAAFPDLECMLDDEIEAESKVAAIWNMRGTHKGSFFGVSPTGRPVKVQGSVFAHTQNRLITESWILIDQMGLLQQLGVVPPPRGNTVF